MGNGGAGEDAWSLNRKNTPLLLAATLSGPRDQGASWEWPEQEGQGVL